MLGKSDFAAGANGFMYFTAGYWPVEINYFQNGQTAPISKIPFTFYYLACYKVGFFQTTVNWKKMYVHSLYSFINIKYMYAVITRR